MRPAIEVGNVVRYFDHQTQSHVEAKVEEIQPFNEVFQDATYDGMYLYLDNDMCVHEDQVKVIT